jgi:subtilisin family serine protease
MVTYQYGGRQGRKYSLKESDEYVVVRTNDRNELIAKRSFATAPVSAATRRLLSEFELHARFADAGVDVLRVRSRQSDRALRDEARARLKKEPAIQFAGRVQADPKSGAPVVYTENLFVKFDGETSRAACRKLLKQYGLDARRELPYARNAYFVRAQEGIGTDVFDLSLRLLEHGAIELAHPELARERAFRAAFTNQWHLRKTTINGMVIDAHASVEAAWQLSEGAAITIAILDDGVDIDHEEFRSAGKVVFPRDVTQKDDDPRPGRGNRHGTACAGVACADGRYGASGVAPRARLMPVRLTSALGTQPEADAFYWAAQNGADIISCSWGPEDGEWFTPSDPLHKEVVPLPDATRTAIDWAIRNGRNGKGCVIVWAAGNGNESVDNDGYASYEKVIAVAACNDFGKRSAYSDFGKAVWCAFPSDNGDPSRTSGIWTTDRSGKDGYNPGRIEHGDTRGNYCNDFGGTSSAAPGVAGVAALVLARNPNLRWDEVRAILKQSCDKIDVTGGKYSSAGHSPFYGYGRVNASKAAILAKPPQPAHVAVRSALQDVSIRDLKAARLSVNVADTKTLKALKVTVDIEHTYIGDLVVTLRPPAAIGVAPIVLHDRTGGSIDNLKATFDSVKVPALSLLNGKKPAGKWTLEVRDRAKEDVGTLRGFSLEMTL